MFDIDKAKIKAAIPIQEYYQDQLGQPHKSNHDHWIYLCCFHNDKNHPNLHVYLDGHFICRACGARGGDVLAFHQKKHSLSFPDVLKEIAEQYAPSLLTSNGQSAKQTIIAVYPYEDQAGDLLYEAIRYGPKKEFKYRRPNGNGGWIWNLQGITTLPYRLPELLASDGTVFVCEGEKDVDRLVGLGLTATTCPMGAGKWRDEYSEWLKDRDVVIIPDNDQVGREHADKIARALHGLAKSIKVVNLPGLPEHGDVSDYLDLHTKIEFLNEVETSLPYKLLSLFDQLPTWNEMREMEINVEWVVDKIIPAQAITVFFGRGGIGKSWLSFDMARSIGNGIPFLERITKRRPVVIVDFENPLSVIKSRTEKLGEAENVIFWKGAPKFDTSDWEKYKEFPKDAVLIFDTLRASHSGDENDSRDMARVMDRVKQLRDSGFTIILIHHTAKGAGNSAKGSTAIVDMADHALNLSIPNSSKPNGNYQDETQEVGPDTIYRFGWRDKTRFEPFECFLNLNTERGFELAPDPKENQLKEMRNLLNNTGPKPKTEFVKLVHSEMGISEARVRDLISRGDGKYWELEKGAHNRQLVKPIQFSSFHDPIGSEKLKIWQTETEPPANKEVCVEEL